MRRRLPGLLALVAIAVLASGCFRIEMAIRVNDDGSGVMSVLMAVEEAVVEAAEQAGESADFFEDVQPDDLPPGASIEEYNEDGFIGSRVTVPFEAGDDVVATLDELFAEASGDTGEVSGGFEDFVLQRDEDGGWRFQMTLEASEDDMGGQDAALAALFLDDASFTVRVELPGEVVEHNADEVDGDVLVWDIDILATEERVLSARTEASSSGSSILPLVVGGGVAVIALGGAGAYFATRRREETPTPPAA